MMVAQPSMTCALGNASSSLTHGSQPRRRFLTQREFQQLKSATECALEVGSLPTCSGAMSPEDKPSLSSASKTCHDSPEVGIESEVETQISDGSELPSSASAVAAVQLELAGSPNVSILSEVQRLRQENLALRSENAELRGSPPQTPMATALPAECGLLAYGISSPTACQQNLRFGAPLRYMVVASPIGTHTQHFEFGFDASDSQNWCCN